MADDWPVVDRNARARRIAAGRSGLQSVFEAALSQAGLEVLQGAADGLPRLTAGQVGTEAVFRAQRRVRAFIGVLKEMRAAQVRGADHGWSAGPVSPAGGFVPVRSPGGKGAGGESARKVVGRLLAELPVGNGLSGLTLVAEAAELPEPVRMNGHPHPLLPTSVALVGPGSPLFHSGLYAVASKADSGLRPNWLPGLERDLEGPILPLVFYNLLTRAPGRSKGGRGAADLALRILIEGLCSVMRRDWQRAQRQPVSVTTTLREFLSWLYGERTPRPKEYWPRLMAAGAALDRNASRFPFRDPVTGREGLRRVVSLVDIPRGPQALDGALTLAVFLPPGSSFRTGGRPPSAAVLGPQVGGRLPRAARSGLRLVPAGGHPLSGVGESGAEVGPESGSGALCAVLAGAHRRAVLPDLDVCEAADPGRARVGRRSQARCGGRSASCREADSAAGRRSWRGGVMPPPGSCVSRAGWRRAGRRGRPAANDV